MKKFFINMIFVLISSLILSNMFSLTAFAEDAYTDTNMYNSNHTINSNIQTNSLTIETKNNISTEKPSLNKRISSCEYMYNFDGSPDYICVQFADGGYIIYATSTMEMLEYSTSGTLPYNTTDTNSKKYYAGPNNYFVKNNNVFTNITTEREYFMETNQTQIISSNIREKIITESNAKYSFNNIYEIESFINQKIQVTNTYELYSTPTLENNFIVPSIYEGYLIPNYKYFLSDPIHGDNVAGGEYGNGNSGTCGPVAAQLLLSFNNYYNDRRIIEDRFLHGYDDSTNTVVLPERNPNYCSDPMYMDQWTTGTRSEDTGTNSFYSEIVTRIMFQETSGSMNIMVKSGINRFLKEHFQSNDYTLNFFYNAFGLSSTQKSKIQSELDNGRPIIISMSQALGGSDHFVVGYGYQDYKYADSDETYSGYVVHYGWPGNDTNCIWINSSWCTGYVSLKMNHEHDYSITSGGLVEQGGTEYKCSVCGHRTDKIIQVPANSRYTEKRTYIDARSYKDYHVTFKTSGIKLVQTFGIIDTVLELYDSNGTLLLSANDTDDDGFEFNALFSYNFSADTEYIIRVRFFDKYKAGYVRLAIVPTYNHDNFEKAYGPYGITTVGWNLRTDQVALFRYKFSTSGDVIFSMSSNYDTYLYVIDPISTDLIKHQLNPDADSVHDDDSGNNGQARITKSIKANKTYLVIISFYNPHTTSGAFSINTSYAS